MKKYRCFIFILFLIIIPTFSLADDIIEESYIYNSDYYIEVSSSTSTTPIINAKHAIILDRASKTILYGKKEILDKMNPFLMGGDMIEFVYEQETTYAPLPNKFEAGTQNVEGVIGFGAAIDYIEKLGYDTIQNLENEIVSYARDELSKLDFLTLYMTPNCENHSSVISFNINGVHPHDVASILDSQNVCVRSGNHCAQPLMRFLSIDSTCRASFYFYNSKEDVDRLVSALIKAYNMFKKYL